MSYFYNNLWIYTVVKYSLLSCLVCFFVSNFYLKVFKLHGECCSVPKLMNTVICLCNYIPCRVHHTVIAYEFLPYYISLWSQWQALRHMKYPSGPFYKHGLTLIPAWISNYIYHKVWHGIAYPFPKFDSCTVEVWDIVSGHPLLPHNILTKLG